MSLLANLDRSFRPYAEELVKILVRAGLRPTVTSARRSRSLQARLWRAWISGRSRLPAARPGTSKHERGLAFDVVVEGARRMSVAQMTTFMRPIGELWESWGGRWGGRFKDPVHFEAP